jgi:hypothetical protein
VTRLRVAHSLSYAEILFSCAFCASGDQAPDPDPSKTSVVLTELNTE